MFWGELYLTWLVPSFVVSNMLGLVSNSTQPRSLDTWASPSWVDTAALPLVTGELSLWAPKGLDTDRPRWMGQPPCLGTRASTERFPRETRPNSPANKRYKREKGRGWLEMADRDAAVGESRPPLGASLLLWREHRRREESILRMKLPWW